MQSRERPIDHGHRITDQEVNVNWLGRGHAPAFGLPGTPAFFSGTGAKIAVTSSTESGDG